MIRQYFSVIYIELLVHFFARSLKDVTLDDAVRNIPRSVDDGSRHFILKSLKDYDFTVDR